MMSLIETFFDADATMMPVFVPLGIIGFYRLLLFMLRLVCYLRYKPLKPSTHADSVSLPTSSDVTVIVPTIDAGEEFQRAAQRWIVNDPFEIIVVTTENLAEQVRTVVNDIAPEKFRVLTVKKANKRRQLVVGINEARTDILALSDDDAIWSNEFLDWLLVPFVNARVGGVGSSQMMTPVGEHKTMWEVIADMRLSMRMMEASATSYLDGGISCLSGRTAVYRREILADVDFQESFVEEKWLGKYPLNSGDDKFITRWLVSHQWDMAFQFDRAASLKTTFKPDWRFLKQLLRWTRNTWRSDFRSLFVDRYVWRRYPYVAFNMLDKMVNPITLLYGPIFITVLCFTHPNWTPWTILISEAIWIFFSRYVRMIEHWRRVPKDLKYLPVYVFFNYMFAFLKIYALCTLHVTGWQTRDNNEDEEELMEQFVSVCVDDKADIPLASTIAMPVKKASKTRSKKEKKEHKKTKKQRDPLMTKVLGDDDDDEQRSVAGVPIELPHNELIEDALDELQPAPALAA